MTAKETKTLSSSISLPSVMIFLIFLIMKLTETEPFADWSWWWITSPLWLPSAIALSILAIAVIAFVSVGAWGMTIIIMEWIKESIKKS